MRLAAVFLLALLAVPSGTVVAQEASASIRETRCWVGGVTFSAGMGINAGDGVAVCKAGSGWTLQEAKAPVAGCLLDGKLSSSGAVVSIRNNDSMLLQCDSTGRWVTIETAAKE
jgi:hypothetical protein